MFLNTHILTSLEDMGISNIVGGLALAGIALAATGCEDNATVVMDRVTYEGPVTLRMVHNVKEGLPDTYLVQFLNASNEVMALIPINALDGEISIRHPDGFVYQNGANPGLVSPEVTARPASE